MSEHVTADDPGLTGLTADFPWWRIWRSRPVGLWWATRRGRIQYDHEPRRPGWGLTIGGVPTLGELAAQLGLQRELDDPGHVTGATVRSGKKSSLSRTAGAICHIEPICRIEHRLAIADHARLP